MQSARLDADGDTWVLVFEEGDEVVRGLRSFARDRGFSAIDFTAAGAFGEVVLGYFDWARRDCAQVVRDEQLEVVALAGFVTADGEDDAPRVQAHVVLEREDGSAIGGHLLEGRVRRTLELVLREASRPPLRPRIATTSSRVSRRAAPSRRPCSRAARADRRGGTR
jgi:predicted DNA-binding protein with PD1-like motif